MRWFQGQGRRVVIGAMALAATVSVGVAHEYRLVDTGEFIVSDSNNVRRLVVAQGTSFQVGVIDNGGCTADIRANKGNKRIVRVDNPRSNGFVQDHTFQFHARKPGTTTFEITVRGEAANGGQEFCDEDSTNPLEIQVIALGGDGKSFARAVRPEIKSVKQAQKQFEADLKSALFQIRDDFENGRISAPDMFLFTTITISAHLFQNLDTIRGALEQVEEDERQRILSAPLGSTLPVPQTLAAGGCGAFDDFLDDLNQLIFGGLAKTKAEAKRHLNRIVRNYQRAGGLMEANLDFGSIPRLRSSGILLDPIDDGYDKDKADVNFSTFFAYKEPDGNTLERGHAFAGRTKGTVSSIVAALRDQDGNEIANSGITPNQAGEFSGVLNIDPLASQALRRVMGINGNDPGTRGRLRISPIILVTPQVVRPSDF